MADASNVRESIEFSVYKPYQCKGGMAKFSFSKKNNCFFLNMAPERSDAEKKFDYDRQVVFKLEFNDLGDLLLVLNRKKQGLGTFKDDKWSGLYHKGETSNSFMNFSVSFDKETKEPKGFYLSLGRTENQQTNKVSIGLSFAESEVLLEFIRAFLPNMFYKTFESKNDTQSSSDSEVKETAKTTKPAKKDKVVTQKDDADIPF
jgi:hypothetical protein